MDRIKAAAAESDFFVLNGDVFDFRWTTLPTIEETVRAAVDWLREFAEAHPQCRILYVMGNHDNLDLFAEHLAELSGRTPNLDWHPSHVRLGNALFLHGDLVFDHWGPASPFVRPFSPTVVKKSKAARAGYRVLHTMRIQRWHAPLFRRKRCAKRVLRSLEAVGLPEGVTDIYFGHTHLKFSNYAHGGLVFHNTGSTIRGLRCGILPVRILGGPDSCAAG